MLYLQLATCHARTQLKGAAYCLRNHDLIDPLRGGLPWAKMRMLRATVTAGSLALAIGLHVLALNPECKVVLIEFRRVVRWTSFYNLKAMNRYCTTRVIRLRERGNPSIVLRRVNTRETRK